ncbi:hypothetical protein D3C78_1358110 [compost metagenome]
MQLLPTSPKAWATAALSPSAATLARLLAAWLKAMATLATSSFWVKNSGLTRVFSSPTDFSVPGPYSAPMPELAMAAMALAAAATCFGS